MNATDFKIYGHNYGHDQISNYREWSNVDTVLFDMSVRLLDKRVKQLGSDFQAEVKTFKNQLERVTEFCSKSEKSPTEELVIGASKWDPGYKVSAQDCVLIFDLHEVKQNLRKSMNNVHGYGRQELEWNYNAWC